MNIIDKNDDLGINLEDIKNKIKNSNLEKELQELLKEGEIYEIKDKYHLLR